VLYLVALRREEVSKMAFFIYLMPVFASLFAWILRGESVAAWTALCGLIIVLGVAISNREGPSPAEGAQPSCGRLAGCLPRKK
jgi:drug/metabolite transporter (DMT)-like permease